MVSGLCCLKSRGCLGLDIMPVHCKAGHDDLCTACFDSQVHMPYACKLLFQELMAMAIAPRMQF